MSNSLPPSEIDKEEQYGEFLEQERWKDRLNRKLAHKAVDIADEEPMNNVGNKSGMGWKELAVVGAIVAGSVGAMSYFVSPQPSPELPTVQPPAIERPAFVDTDTKPKLRFRMPVVPPQGGDE